MLSLGEGFERVGNLKVDMKTTVLQLEILQISYYCIL